MGLEVALVGAIIGAVTSVVSLAMTISMRNDIKNDPIKDNGTGIDRKGQNSPKVVAFGRCLVPSIRVWNNVNNRNTSYLAQAHSFGVGPIMKYEQLYIDGVPYFADDATINIGSWYDGDGGQTSAEFPNLDLGLRIGANTETAYSQLFEHSDGEWDASCRGDRTASCSLLVKRVLNKEEDNNIRIMSDRFKMEALVHGNKVIDPRYSVTNLAWVNGNHQSYRNPACVLFTYLTDAYYGMGVPVDAIDVNSFIELANYCDSKGYKFDGYIDQGNDYGQIIMDMCSSFDGMVYVENGRIVAKSDCEAPVVSHITDDDIVGSFRLSNTNDGAYFNVINIEFINTDANHTVDKYVLPKDVTQCPIIREDGFEKKKDLKLIYTSDGGSFNTIKRIANKHLKAARFQQTIEFEVDNTIKPIKVYDVIEVTNEFYKLDRKKFRVFKVQTSLDDKTTITKVFAEEYDASVYDSSSYEDGNTSTPVNPPSSKIPSPVNLAFTQTGFTTSGYGELKWEARYNKEHRTVVEYKLSSASNWKRAGEVIGNDYDFVNLAPDNYDFRVMTKNFMGSTSNWTIIQGIKVNGGVTLPTPTNGSTVFVGKSCLVSWSDVKSLPLVIPDGVHYDGVKTVGDVFSHYEIVVLKGNSHEYHETLTSTTNKFTYTYDMNVSSGVNRDIRFNVKVVAKDGSESAALVVDAFNSQMPQPSGVKVNGELTNLQIYWDEVNDKFEDYSGSDIHISTVANFTPSASTLVATSTSGIVSLNKKYTGTNYLRVGHYDKFGKDGMAYCAAIPFTMQTIDDLLNDSANWGDSLIEIDGIKNEINKAKEDIIDNAESINSHGTQLGQHGALISQNATAIQGVAGNLAEFETSVEAEFDGVKGSITTNQTAIANANKAITALDTKLSSEIDGVQSNISNNYYTKTQTDGKVSSAVSAAKTELTSNINDVKANLANNYYTKTSTDGKISTAVAASESKLNAEIGKNKAAITTLNQVTATTDGKVEALTQIKHDVNGKISGLIMGNDGETSTFDVIADKFRISSSAGSQAVFQVDSATGKTIIRNALIEGLTASNIAADAITGNHIASNTKIIAGSGTSSATMDGQDATWRLYAGHSTGGSAPFRVDKTGKVYATNVDITGKVTATSGSFKGSIEASSGKFTGTVYVGNNTSESAGTVRLRSGAANSSSHAIDVYAGGKARFVLRHNGQLQMFNTSGSEMINFNPASNSFVFKGTIQANQVQGVKTLMGSGSISLSGKRDLSQLIHTGINVASWGDAKSTYVVECSVGGTVRANSNETHLAWWGGWGEEVHVYSHWSGSRTNVRFRARFATEYCWGDSNCVLNWKLYKIF